VGTRRSNRRASRRRGNIAGRGLTQAARTRSLGQQQPRHRKADRPVPQDGPSASTTPRPIPQATDKPTKPLLGPEELALGVQALARKGVYNVGVIAQRLGVTEARVNAAIAAITKTTPPGEAGRGATKGTPQW
jgi:hypothetical protein